MTSAVAFSPDALQVRTASGSSDGAVRLWTTATGQPLDIGPLFCNRVVRTLTFSPDGRLIAAGDEDGFIHFWHVETGRPAYEPLETGHYPESALVIAFSPASMHIVSGGHGMVAHVWDISTGQQVLALSGHINTIRSIAYSPDGQFIVTCGEDSTFLIWSAATGMLLSTVYAHGYLASVMFTPGGRCLMVSCSRDAIHIRDFEADCLPISSGNVCDTLAVLGSRGLGLDGWSLGPAGELLLWVPAEYRDYLQVFPCKMLIAERRIVVTADESGLFDGENWTACWRG